jgi:hypothetical protein
MSCMSCDASGVKLWREWQRCATSLLCTRCAEREQGRKRDGTSIGWRVPAVPVEGQPGSFWSYWAIPKDALDRWHRLPT